MAVQRRRQAGHRRCQGDRGDVMLMTTVLIIFLMLASWALLSASQAWGARRDAQAVAAAAARAGAQTDADAVRRGATTIDPSSASARATAVLSASGYGGSVSVRGLTVTVTASRGVRYAFPAPGFPGSMTATASAVAARGVRGDEGG